MNDDDLSFDRVKRYDLGATIATVTTTINDPNMKGFLFVPGVDINTDPATLSAVVLDPSGITFSIDYTIAASYFAGDPNGNLTGTTSSEALIGNLIDNTMPFGLIFHLPQFYPHTIIEATANYGDSILSPSALYTFF